MKSGFCPRVTEPRSSTEPVITITTSTYYRPRSGGYVVVEPPRSRYNPPVPVI